MIRLDFYGVFLVFPTFTDSILQHLHKKRAVERQLLWLYFNLKEEKTATTLAWLLHGSPRLWLRRSAVTSRAPTSARADHSVVIATSLAIIKANHFGRRRRPKWLADVRNRLK
jgi:hypothetical protein